MHHLEHGEIKVDQVFWVWASEIPEMIFKIGLVFAFGSFLEWVPSYN